MYHFWGMGQSWRASQLFDPFAVVAVVVAVTLVTGVWRLWRGMRLDEFERTIRTLQQQPAARWQSPKTAKSHTKKGTHGKLFQISLLPLMLVSVAIAMLLAQAQRPDDVSRPFTWLLFVGVGTWYCMTKWSHCRGIGPLRNQAFAAVSSAALISSLLWSFYLVVDLCHGEPGYQRLSTSVPTLLWWSGLGAVVGYMLASYRSESVYRRARATKVDANRESTIERSSISTKSSDSVRHGRFRERLRMRWSTIGMACGASLVFHLSAAPHVYRSIYFQYIYWDRYQLDDWSANPLTLTMAPISRTPNTAVRGHVVIWDGVKGVQANTVPLHWSWVPQAPLGDVKAGMAVTKDASATPQTTPGDPLILTLPSLSNEESDATMQSVAQSLPQSLDAVDYSGDTDIWWLHVKTDQNVSAIGEPQFVEGNTIVPRDGDLPSEVPTLGTGFDGEGESVDPVEAETMTRGDVAGGKALKDGDTIVQKGEQAPVQEGETTIGEQLDRFAGMGKDVVITLVDGTVAYGRLSREGNIVTLTVNHGESAQSKKVRLSSIRSVEALTGYPLYMGPVVSELESPTSDAIVADPSKDKQGEQTATTPNKKSNVTNSGVRSRVRSRGAPLPVDTF